MTTLRMRPERYFRWSLCLPIVLPYVWLHGEHALRDLGMLSRPTVIGDVLAVSLMFAGAQYVVFAVLCAWLLRRASLGRLQMLSLVVPLAFGAFIYATELGTTLPRWTAFDRAWDFAGLGAIVGYGYVVLVHLMFGALKLAGALDTSRAAEPLGR